MNPSVTITWTVMLVIVSFSIEGSESIPSVRRGSISCFSCSSRNKTHEACHDPMHPANTSYMTNCKVPQENHIGVFPALFCVKVIGVSEKTNEEVIIRTCSIENMDNQCGTFKFEDEMLRGCILTCHYDGCNSAPKQGIGNIVVVLGLISFGINYLSTT